MGSPKLFILSVLLVAPSTSLAGPLPQQQQQQIQAGNHNPRPATNLPWQAVGGPGGGYVYCADCSPLTQDQVVLPANFQVNQKAASEASGVLPPQQQINSLGAAEPGKQPGAKTFSDGGVPVQQMAMHDDGRYSFSYNTANSARQEERQLDGMVSGSYSYFDPDGKQVQVDYTAGPQIGYKAYGDNVPSHQPVVQLPQPVRDTIEVQLARQQFLDAYSRELARIQRDQEAAAAAAATAQPIDPTDGAEAIVPVVSQDEEVASDAVAATKEGDQPVVVIPEEALQGVDDQTDSVVIPADNVANPLTSSSPNPAYQITIPIGNGDVSVQTPGQDAVQQAAVGHSAPVQPTQSGQALQPYFYYVSVGGSPHFVTTYPQSGYNSPYPTSLRATLLGALPLGAVHDSQVPNRGDQQQVALTQPLYLDPANSVQDQQQQQNPATYNPASLLNSLGQLYPISLLPSGGQTIGYIPAVVLNNNQPSMNTQPQQTAQHQQMNYPQMSQGTNSPMSTLGLMNHPQNFQNTNSPQNFQPSQNQNHQNPQQSGFNYPMNTLGLVNHPQNFQNPNNPQNFQNYPQSFPNTNFQNFNSPQNRPMMNYPQNQNGQGGFNYPQMSPGFGYPQMSQGAQNPLGLVNYPQNVPGSGSYTQNFGAGNPSQNVGASNPSPQNVGGGQQNGSQNGNSPRQDQPASVATSQDNQGDSTIVRGA